MSENDKATGAYSEYAMLMMRHFDGESTPEEEARLAEHVKTCERCAKAFGQYDKIVTATAQVKLKEPAAEEWDRYWERVENRMERGIAWTLVTVGVIIVAAFALVSIVTWVAASTALPWWAKGGVYALAAGLVWLFVTVVREKWSLRKTDKYRGVRR